VAGELEPGSEHGGVGPDEGIALAADDGGWERLAFEAGELGFVVEEFELAGCAGHEQVDDAFGLGGEVGLARKEGGRRIDGRGEGAPGELVREQACEGDLAEANAAPAEEVPSGDVEAVLLEGIHERLGCPQTMGSEVVTDVAMGGFISPW
jgi:hypothetical protein